MGMTSEQAKAMALRPRITAEEEDQMVSLRAEGKKPPEIALLFPAYAQGTIANLYPRLFKPFTGLAAQLNFFFCYILSPAGLADDLVAGWFG
jgi:hypothetical protein